MITVVAPNVACLSSDATCVHTMAPPNVVIIMIIIIIGTSCRFNDNTCLLQRISPSQLRSPLFGHTPDTVSAVVTNGRREDDDGGPGAAGCGKI